MLVYQRYQDFPFLEAVCLASALQRCGCHFTTGTSVRLFLLLSERFPYVNIKPNSDWPLLVPIILFVNLVEFLVLHRFKLQKILHTRLSINIIVSLMKMDRYAGIQKKILIQSTYSKRQCCIQHSA